MITQLTEKKLRILIQESVQRAIEAQLMKMRGLLLPFISTKEQKEIEHLYGKPSRKTAEIYDIDL